jgi:hypothetical protein
MMFGGLVSRVHHVYIVGGTATESSGSSGSSLFCVLLFFDLLILDVILDVMVKVMIMVMMIMVVFVVSVVCLMDWTGLD